MSAFDNMRSVRLYADFYGTEEELQTMIAALEIPKDRENIFFIKEIRSPYPKRVFTVSEFLDTN